MFYRRHKDVANKDSKPEIHVHSAFNRDELRVTSAHDASSFPQSARPVQPTYDHSEITPYGTTSGAPARHGSVNNKHPRDAGPSSPVYEEYTEVQKPKQAGKESITDVYAEVSKPKRQSDSHNQQMAPGSDTGGVAASGELTDVYAVVDKPRKTHANPAEGIPENIPTIEDEYAVTFIENEIYN